MGVSERPASLPRGWLTCRIGDITDRVEKIDPRDKPGQEIFYIDISGIDNKANRIAETKRLRLAKAPSRARQIVRKGDVLFSMVRPYLRNIAQVHSEPGNLIASTGFSVLRPAAGIAPRFLFYKAISQDFVGSLSEEQYGVSYPAVKDSQVRDQPIWLPPLNEQNRIIEKIDRLFTWLDKGEEALREVQKLLDRYRQSILKAAVTGQLTADWRAENAHRLEHGRDLLALVLKKRREDWDGRGKYKEPVAPDTTNLPDLSEGWVWATVDHVLRADLSNGRSVPDAVEGFPVLRLNALKDGRVDLSKRKIGAWDATSAEPFLIARGDILVSRGNGSKQLVGRGGLVKQDPDPVAYPDTMIRIPILLKYLSAKWFLQLWNSPFMRGQIEKAAKTTAGIYKINQNDIKDFAVPLPPLAEQIEIEALVDEKAERIAHLEFWCNTELARSTALRQSILKDAFAGRLVPQDPADEPASVLLARIKAAQSGAPKKARQKATV